MSFCYDSWNLFLGWSLGAPAPSRAALEARKQPTRRDQSRISPRPDQRKLRLSLETGKRLAPSGAPHSSGFALTLSSSFGCIPDTTAPASSRVAFTQEYLPAWWEGLPKFTPNQGSSSAPMLPLVTLRGLSDAIPQVSHSSSISLIHPRHPFHPSFAPHPHILGASCSHRASSWVIKRVNSAHSRAAPGYSVTFNK